MAMSGLTAGRIVHFVLPNGEHRPAIIVRVWDPKTTEYPEGTVNLQVFLDGQNDSEVVTMSQEDADVGLVWRTSIHYSEKPIPGTWHWIEHA